MSILTLLGTGTCQIEYERRASSVLLELDGTYVLYDCGHGIVQRLLEVGVQHSALQHIVFSHFHADHISDIIPLLQAGAWSRTNPRIQDLHLYGSPGLQTIIDGILNVFGGGALQQPTYEIVVHEIADQDQQFAIGPYRFDFINLPPAGNHGLRFAWQGKTYAVTGDSYFHEAEIDFLKQVDLAIIDAGHIEDDEIVQLAVRSRAKTVICSHLYREIDSIKLQAQAAQAGYSGTIITGRDFLSFVL
jgi:ribonuclease BN (tRNA processing enzyme)